MRSLLIGAIVLGTLSGAEPTAGPASWIDPFIGSEGGGNVTVGPSQPFGMCKPGPDVGSNGSNSGWESKGPIHGFSQTHVSGTGGGCKYGNVLVMPLIGDATAAPISAERDQERTACGYYGVTLKPSAIAVEITTSGRAACYRFTYPAASNAKLQFDLGHCLRSHVKGGEGQTVVASQATVVSPTEVSGSTSVIGGWNRQKLPYTVYFYARSDTPAVESGTWQGQELHPGKAQDSGATPQAATGAWLGFATPSSSTAGLRVQLGVGISFVSVDQAKRNLLQEIGAADFDRVRADTVAAWNQVLAPLTIDGATPDQRTVFTTALYHTMLMPVDRTGENPLWASEEPYYDDFYAIWDTFRSSSPLLTLIAERRQVDMLRALIDLYRQEGWIPDARSGNANGRTQGGTDVDVMLADAWVKKLPGLDWATAYAAMVKHAEIKPDDHYLVGRGGIEDWKTLGYLPIGSVDMPGSRQMEYAANDAAIATVAKALGHDAEAATYLVRSGNWEKLWNDGFTVDGFSGFIHPRRRDGTWKTPFTATQGCSWNGDTFYEGNSWIYSFYVPHDVARVMVKCGGAKRFVERLDWYFEHGKFDVGNEPGFLTPYLYLWAGRHDQTATRTRQILARSFSGRRNGIPGNDDSGAMSSWFVWTALGLFPVAGQDVYLIGSPLYPASSFTLSNGKIFRITADNTSADNRFVSAATWAGKPLDRAWLRHGELMQGGTLALTMGANPAPGLPAHRRRP